MGKIVEIIAFVIFLAAFIFTVVSFACPWWIENTTAGVSTSLGLFQACVKVEAGDEGWTCEKIETQYWEAKHKATVAMLSIAIAVNLGTFAVMCMSLCGKMSIKIGAGLSACCGILGLIAVVIFATILTDDDASYPKDVVEYFGWAYWIAAVSAGAHIANSIITFILDCISCC